VNQRPDAFSNHSDHPLFLGDEGVDAGGLAVEVVGD
jgi:hypothetical protein